MSAGLPGQSRKSRWIWTTTPEWLALAACAYFVLFCNNRFWESVTSHLMFASLRNLAFLGSAALTLTGLFLMALLPLTARHTIKPLLGVMFVANAAALYFVDTYHVYLDDGMLRNALQTDLAETRELLSPGMLRYLLVYGVLPTLALGMVRFRAQPPGRALLRRAALFAAAGLLVAASVSGFFQEYLSFTRGHREVRYLLTPSNYVAAIARYLTVGAAHAGPAQRTVVGGDARLAAGAPAGRKPLLFVLVVGEAARVEEFELNGYGRNTTPYLRQADIVNFTDVSSCGTSTAESLPCMFSPFGHGGTDADTARVYESLLDVVQRAGFDVLWLDNNSGCKGVCVGVESRQLNAGDTARQCPEGECYDEILAQELDKEVGRRQGNLFVVLHQHGSHGPADFRRYPAGFERFTPVCRASELHDCSASEVRNAYDNTILYTDFVLHRLIEQLGTYADRYDTAMLYVSDHGESLGENGLYLHGLPYAIAPRSQTHVPLIFWMSPGFGREFAVNSGCLATEAGRAHSHDDLFHSVLGLLEIHTSVYDRSHDLFAHCKRHIA